MACMSTVISSPSPPGFVDHPIVTDCVGELPSDKYFDDGAHVAVLACASVGVVIIP